MKKRKMQTCLLAVLATAILYLGTAAGIAEAQTILVDDNLTDGGGCSTEDCGGGRTVNGGEFTGSGWVPHASDDMVMYDLGEITVAGSVDFTVFGFAPYSQYQCGSGDQYVEFVGISEGPHCDHWAGSEAYIMVLYAPGRDASCNPLDGAPNHQSSMRGALNMGCEWQQCFPTVYSDPETPIDHRFRLEWDVSGARLYSTENPAEEPTLVDQIGFDAYPNECSCECEQPLMNHVCLGGTNSSVGWFDGPVFSNVVITKMADYVPQDCCEEGVETAENVDFVETPAEESVQDLPGEPDARPDTVQDPDADGEGDGGGESGCGCHMAR
jgi:hypothetical protein